MMAFASMDAIMGLGLGEIGVWDSPPHPAAMTIPSTQIVALIALNALDSVWTSVA
jgi:hypothetical protein